MYIRPTELSPTFSIAPNFLPHIIPYPAPLSPSQGTWSGHKRDFGLSGDARYPEPVLMVTGNQLIVGNNGMWSRGKGEGGGKRERERVGRGGRSWGRGRREGGEVERRKEIRTKKDETNLVGWKRGVGRREKAKQMKVRYETTQNEFEKEEITTIRTIMPKIPILGRDRTQRHPNEKKNDRR